MTKQTYTAIFKGLCYIKGNGRKLYKYGIKLQDVRNNGMITLCQTCVSNSKAFASLTTSDCDKTIMFDAVEKDGTLKYISNVQIIK